MAARRRNGAVSALSLTERVFDAVCLLMIRCGASVAAVGQQAVGLVERSGQAGDGQAPVAYVDIVELEVADGLEAWAACTQARARASRTAGVVAVYARPDPADPSAQWFFALIITVEHGYVRMVGGIRSKRHDTGPLPVLGRRAGRPEETCRK